MARKAEIKKTSEVFNFDNLFKVDQLEVTHEQVDGSMSASQTRLVFERGDAAAVLLLNLDSRSVILVEQFKVPTLVGRRRDDPATTDGWVTETVAGMVDPKETPLAAAIRETKEESGYQIRDPKLISTFFSSPGGTSERIFLYFAEVHDVDKVEKGGGIGDEDIKVVQLPVDELFDRLAKGSIDDPKLLIAAYWLQSYLRSREALQLALGDLFGRLEKKSIEDPKLVAAASWLQDQLRPGDDRQRLIQSFWTHDRATGPEPSSAGRLSLSTVRYAIKGKPDLFIGYKTGAIDNIKDVSLWVNSENTDMMMDRFLGKSISARIRHLGANRDENEAVMEDTIEESLRNAVGRRGHVKIGTVLVTGSGALEASHNVQRILHVATVEGIGAGLGVKADPTNLAYCVDRLLKRVEEENSPLLRFWTRRKNFESILIPMLGAGDGGMTVEAVAQTIIPAAIEHFQHAVNPTLKQIYFLAFTSRHKRACDQTLDEYRSKGILV